MGFEACPDALAQTRHAAIEAAIRPGEVIAGSSPYKLAGAHGNVRPPEETKMTNTSITQNDTPTTPTTGDTSPFAEAVAKIQQALDMIAAAIPTIPLTLQSTRTYIRRRQGTMPVLIARAATAAEETPALQGLLDVAGTRHNLAFNDAIGPLFERMDPISRSNGSIRRGGAEAPPRTLSKRLPVTSRSGQGRALPAWRRG
jgi:hypothetical protein